MIDTQRRFTLPIPSANGTHTDGAPATSAPVPPDITKPKSLAVEPLMVGTDQAAAACGISPASWYRLQAAGKTPAPVKLGGRTLYRLADLELWVLLGCPPRREFEARRAAAKK